MAEKNTKKKNKEMGGLFIPAGLFIGMGFGFLYDNFTAGLFIGLGAGFAAFGLSALIFKK
jgi:hypothetical protein